MDRFTGNQFLPLLSSQLYLHFLKQDIKLTVTSLLLRMKIVNKMCDADSSENERVRPTGNKGRCSKQKSKKTL